MGWHTPIYSFYRGVPLPPPPPHRVGGPIISDQHDCDEGPPQVDEYNTDSEDNSLEIEDHDIAPPTGTISASGRPVRARF